jgi:hypothetical protein
MSKPSTLRGAHSVTVIVPSEVSPKRERLEVLGVRLADVLHDQLGCSRFWPMPACASTLDRTPPGHRLLSNSTANQFTEYSTPTQDRSRIFSAYALGGFPLRPISCAFGQA